MKAVILAAGKGSRMWPLTKTRPKVMIPILNVPLLEHSLLSLKAAGVDDFLIVTGYLGNVISGHFRDGSRLGISVRYIAQSTDPEAPYGTAIAAALAQEFVGDEPFVLTFGDIMTPSENYANLTRAYDNHPGAAYLCVNWCDDPSSGGAVFVRDGRVVDIVEKPPEGTADTNFINSGIFILRPEIFDIIETLQPSARGEYELTEAVERMIKQGIHTRAHELIGYWSNVGGPTEVMWLNRLLLQNLAIEEEKANGKDRRSIVFVGQNTNIHDEAHITGPVLIGDNCDIGHCRIGRYTCIDRDCQVGNGASISASALLSGSVVGDNCRVNFALLGSHVQVRPGASLLGTANATTVIEDNHIISLA